MNTHSGVVPFVVQYLNANNRWRFYHDDNPAAGAKGIWFQAEAGGVQINLQGGGEIADSNWHHIAFVKVGNDHGIYKDGVQIVYQNTANVANIDGSLYIGSNGIPSLYLDGWMDELRIQRKNI